MCNFYVPLGDVRAFDTAPGSPVDGSLRLDFGDTQITALAAITVDDTSVIYAGYTNSSGNFVGPVRFSYLLTIVLKLIYIPFKSSFTSLQVHLHLVQRIHSANI